MTLRSTFNAFARRSPALAALKASVLRPIDQALHKRERALADALRVFVPNSVMEPGMLGRLTLQSAEQTVPFLAPAAAALHGAQLPKAIPIEAFAITPAQRETAMRLKAVLGQHGSDKAARHNYHHLYGAILANFPADGAILEIGLGTNNPDVASNMGPNGKPGASLRAFSQMLPGARIFGADVDRRILFQEDAIATFFVDQTNPGTLAALGDKLPKSIDLIIDDGLHAPNANLATLSFALPRLAAGGWFVVEDIAHSAEPLWRVMAVLAGPHYRTWVVRSEAALLFVVHKPRGGDHADIPQAQA